MQPQRATIAPLTGLRAFAALWVVSHHLRRPILTLVPDSEALERFLAAGFLGVDLFALLSGFVISYNYAEALRRPSARATLRYLRLRLARIYPLHLFTLGLMLLAYLALPRFGSAAIESANYGARDFLLNLLLIHGWGLNAGPSWNVPSWTVSAEWFCYLCFPLAAPWLVRLRDRGLCIALAGVALGATLSALRAADLTLVVSSTQYALVRIGGEFLTGCLLFRIDALSAPWRRVAAWLAPLALVGALGCVELGFEPGVVACFALLVLALAQQAGPLAALLSRRSALFWGEASYSIYLMHWVVIRGLDAMGGTPFGALASPLERASLLGWYLLAVLASSVVSYLGVERPARRWLRRGAGA